jgi:SIR2-like domain
VAGELERLRVALDDARSLVQELGDEPRRPVARGRYLHDPALRDAIEHIARDKRPITLVVGAGASIEADLPSWPELVRALVIDAAPKVVDEPHQAAWCKSVLVEGLPAAAAVVEALTESEADFHARLGAALYRGREASDYAPAALAQQVAWLKSKLGGDVRIVTANYDDLLERAFRERRERVRSLVRPADETDAPSVLHLHGRLVPKTSTGEIVLTEADYSHVQYGGSWQEEYMRHALSETLCVFVGLSLTDPNLIRWLYRYPGRRGGHVAVFARQSTPALSRPVRAALERSTGQRWRRVRVEPVWADFFGEAAQFLHEVGLRRTGSPVPPFAERAQLAWTQGREHVVPRSPARFRRQQERWSRFLNDLLGDIRALAAAEGTDLSKERLGLGVWGADHRSGTATLWATSDRRLNGRGTLVSRPFEFQSRWIGVEAITRGVQVERDPAVFTSRWRLVRGIPIVVPADGSDGRVIVGAITLTSESTAATSRLKQLPNGVLRGIDRFLASVAARLFQE